MIDQQVKQGKWPTREMAYYVLRRRITNIANLWNSNKIVIRKNLECMEKC
jgi:hypothetical protein